MNLEDLGINLEDLKEKVVFDVRQQLMKEVGEELTKEIRKGFVQEMKTKLYDEAVLKLDTLMVEMIHETYQPIDDYGDPIGKPTTLRDHFKKSIEVWWTQKVDSSGNKSTSYRANQRHEWMVKTVVEDIVSKEFRKHLEKFVDEAKTKMRESMTKALAGEFKNLFK